MGRATKREYVTGSKTHISIHALRGEGDPASATVALYVYVFQSTPSVGRATTSGGDSLSLSQFQSTPSVGRATIQKRPSSPLHTISIHALRGEGDDVQAHWFEPAKISIHALRGEGDV